MKKIVKFIAILLLCASCFGAWKSEITNVEQSVDKVVITYDIFDDADILKAQGEQIVIANPTTKTVTMLKALLTEKAKRMEIASEIATSLTQFIGVKIEVD